MIIPHQSGADLEFQARGAEVLKKKKNPNKYPYSTNKLSTKINTHNHCFLKH